MFLDAFLVYYLNMLSVLPYDGPTWVWVKLEPGCPGTENCGRNEPNVAAGPVKPVKLVPWKPAGNWAIV